MSSPVEKSIIRLFTEDGMIVGAGFLVSARHALTCAHVVARALGPTDNLPDAPTERVSFDFPFNGSNGRFTGRVVSWQQDRCGERGQPDGDGDMALIALESEGPEGCAPAPLMVSDHLRRIEVEAFGFPDNMDRGVPASGIITGGITGGCAVVEDTKQHGYFAGLGFSGGPVWVEAKRMKGVVGMVVRADETNRTAYVWDHLALHLIEAARVEELAATVRDLRYLARKTWAKDAAATEQDLLKAEKQMEDALVYTLRRNFTGCGHLLARGARKNDGRLSDLMATLHSRFQHIAALAPLARELEPQIARPCVTSLHPLPDLPHPDLIRTLTGHTFGVMGCAMSADGSLIVSASDDNTLKVWDSSTSPELRTLTGHTSLVRGCAMSADGSLIVSASDDKTLKVWDSSTGVCLATFNAEGSLYGCVCYADGRLIVAVGAAGVYFLRLER